MGKNYCSLLPLEEHVVPLAADVAVSASKWGCSSALVFRENKQPVTTRRCRSWSCCLGIAPGTRRRGGLVGWFLF